MRTRQKNGTLSAVAEVVNHYSLLGNKLETSKQLNITFTVLWGIPHRAVAKNQPANAGDVRDMASIPGSGRSPREWNGKPLQYSGLENSIDRWAWHAIVHGGPKESDTMELHKQILFYGIT